MFFKNYAKIILFIISIYFGGLVMASPFEDALTAVARKDYTSAFNIWLQLAEQGNPSAQNNIGYMFQRGEGVNTSPKDAFKWWRLAAESGLADAQNNLGNCYTYGFGVAENLTEAFKWYQLAANQGYAMAQSNMGASYGTGSGVSQNWVESTKWYRLSADQGEALGQSNLGVAYANGQGIAQNFVEAYKWYTLATITFSKNNDRVGLDRAIENRSMLSRYMSKIQINKGLELAAKWKPVN